jgi:hypothetical protein
MPDVSVSVKGEEEMGSQTVIVGPLKSVILYSLQILQERIFQCHKMESCSF